MAKLSLWLITMDKGRAFTFLDHALKCGDSLVGVNLRQLRYWRLDTDGMTQQAAFAYEFEIQREKIIALRRQISRLPVNTVDDQHHKAHLLSEADKLAHNLRAASDALVWSYFNDLAKAEQERFREALLLAHRDGKDVPDEWQHVPTLEEQELRPFHWELEFPEVFLDGRAGFDAFMSNPPFIGGRRIREMLGDAYRDALYAFYPGSSGNADYSAFFFLRAYANLRSNGALGLIATNTIAQGDTRRTGLDVIVERGGIIFKATNNQPWPGQAAVSVNIVHTARREFSPPFILDGRTVEHISSLLDSRQTTGEPHVLATNSERCFQGSVVVGVGFILEPEEAKALLNANPMNRNVLFPYINAEDLNNTPDQSATRWIINFFDWPLEQAEQYTEPMRIVRERVKPQRDEVRRKAHREYWWHYVCVSHRSFQSWSLLRRSSSSKKLSRPKNR